MGSVYIQSNSPITSGSSRSLTQDRFRIRIQIHVSLYSAVSEV
jgi:hypothetical protein